MTRNVIKIRGVSKSYNNQVTLNNINLHATKGEFLTLLGPSGCGKTTILRLISGFETPDSGEIFIDGINAAGIHASQRPVHTVFQNYALFPHMTVFENVAFGLRCQKVSKTEITQRVSEVLKRVRLDHLGHRKATQLSGGQQQRVAIARAVVNKPSVLLLDEPLSSLDYSLRKNMQIELKQLQRKLGITFIFVTHDQEEALSMSDRIIVMDHGKIEQVGTPREIYETPVNLTVAKFIGEVNVFDAVIAEADASRIMLKINGQKYETHNKNKYNIGDRVHIVVRPEDIRVWHKNTHEDLGTTIPAIVEEAIYKGSTVDIIARLKNNKLIKTTQFFDEDDENLIYEVNESVLLHWIPGWEVILPYEV